MLRTTHAGFFSSQVSLPLPSTTFRNLIDWHTLSSKSVDFRFPNNGSNSTQNTSSINNRSTPWDPHAEIQLISGGSFGEVYSARRNEPWKFLQNVGLLNTWVGAWIVRFMSLQQAVVWLESLYILYIYIYYYILDMWGFIFTCIYIYTWYIYIYTVYRYLYLNTYIDVLAWEGGSVCFACCLQQQTGKITKQFSRQRVVPVEDSS